MTDFDLRAYLTRIGGPPTSPLNAATLGAVHRAHVQHIPFENLEIQMGGRITLDAETLQAKMVRRRRGGYCFEQNNLLLLALRAIGFEAEGREARVRQGSDGTVRPRTHMVLIVRCDGRDYLADVGFGGDGLLEPIELDGGESEQAGMFYRVISEGAVRVLQRRLEADFEDLYAIEPGVPDAIDFEVGNWYTSTHPRSAFVLRLTAQRLTPDARHILRNLTYVVRRGARVETSEISRQDLIPLLRDVFGIDLPEQTTFSAIDGVP
jgi:N-hydroxyarylamine O-acetyltransferase